MNKAILVIIIVVLAAVGVYYALSNNTTPSQEQGDQQTMQNTETNAVSSGNIAITPIMHATMALSWNGKSLYTDPTGGAAAFSGIPEPDLILITDIHGDHLNAETVQAVAKDKTTIIVPQAVAERLANTVPGNMKVLNNGEKIEEQGFTIEAVPMYNVPESPTAPHTKGRGNGYVIEANGERVYISGDTGNTPEIRALENIDLAFVTMNLPFTMSVEDAASAVLSFKPARVIPYHYRGQDGLSDTGKFKELVNAGNPSIEVELLNFYPNP